MTFTCQQALTHLDDAVDGALDPAVRVRFERHLASCPACAAELDTSRSLRSTMLSIGLDSAPQGLRESIARLVRSEGPVPAADEDPAGDVPERIVRFDRHRLFGRVAAAVLVGIGLLFGTRAFLDRADPAPPARRNDVVAEARDGKLEGSGMAEGAARPAAGATPSPVVPGNPVSDDLAGGAAKKDATPGAAPAPGRRIEIPAELAAEHARLQRRLDEARRLADAEPVAPPELADQATVRRFIEAEEKRRLAGFITALDENAEALAEAVPPDAAPAIEAMIGDSDSALVYFDDSTWDAKRGGGRDEPAASADPRGAEARPGSKAKSAVPPAAEGRSSERQAGPAFFILSGAQANREVDKVLAARGVARREVPLHRMSAESDSAERARMRDRIEAREKGRAGDDVARGEARRSAGDRLDATLKPRQPEFKRSPAESYKIWEIDVPESAATDLVGALESIPGVKITPVGEAWIGTDSPSAPDSRVAIDTGTGLLGSRESAAGGGGDRVSPPAGKRTLRLVVVDA